MVTPTYQDHINLTNVVRGMAAGGNPQLPTGWSWLVVPTDPTVVGSGGSIPSIGFQAATFFIGPKPASSRCGTGLNRCRSPTAKSSDRT
jgi:hypothetical protein